MPASQRPFVGATPYPGGVTFRVWAPNATQVFAAGDFNGWSPTAAPLFAEGGGYWSTDVAGAAVGHHYKFVIHTQNPADQPLWHNDPYARSLIWTSKGQNSLIASSEEGFASPGYSTPAWNDTVIYELHVGSFARDPANPQHPGSFTTTITALDYLRELGVNAIEVMALAEFEGTVSWGYNPACIFAVEADYGGPDGFRRFVNEAHRRGIAVILDVVYNHLGYPSDDMWRFDGWSANGKGGIYFYNDWRSTTAWGDTRFDYGRGEVRQYLRDNALRWLEQRFADGLRWDSTGSIRNVHDQNNDPAGDIPDGWGLMQWINTEIRARQSWKLSIAEDMKDNEWLTKDPGAGGAGFSAQWGAGFVHAVRQAVIVPDDQERDLCAVRDVIAQKYNGDAFQRVIFTESHDEDGNGRSRVPEMIWPGNAGSWYSRKRSTLGAAVVFTAPGIPMIFMGQEFLENGWFHDNPEPLDWSKTRTYNGILLLYRDLIRLRRNWFNHTRGLGGQGVNVFHVNNQDKLLAFHRWDRGGPGDDVVVVLNFANRGYTSYNLGFPRAGHWRVRFNSDSQGYSPDFTDWSGYDSQANGPGRDNLPASGNVGIGPYSALILSQD